MTLQDLSLTDGAIRQEAVGRLGVRPILTDQRNRLTYRSCHLNKQLPQPPA